VLVKIDTYFDGEYWCARGVNEDIFTQGATYDELLTNIKEAVTLHLEDELKKGKSAYFHTEP
jgi:predicted RNase H-like HicB family nuclease